MDISLMLLTAALTVGCVCVVFGFGAFLDWRDRR